MREQSVVLKNGIRAAFVRRHSCYIIIVKQNRAFVGKFETGDNSEQSRFAAAGRTEQRKKLALFYGEIDIIQSMKAAEMFRHAVDGNRAAFQCFSCSPCFMTLGATCTMQKIRGIVNRKSEKSLNKSA